jgi:hypothetical protein
MAGARKHGAHRYALSGATAAAATAFSPDAITFDAYAAGSLVAGSFAGYDVSQEAVTELVLVLGTTLTGQATNFTSFRVRLFNAAGALQNSIQVNYSAAGVTSTLWVPIDLAVASGAVVPGAGTGVLTVNSGVALPWNLGPGFTLVFDTAITGTGQYVGAASLTALVQSVGS